MRVILLADQRDLGRRGEVIDVKPTYGKQYLLPQGIALEATDANIESFQHQRSKVPVPSRWDDVLGPFYSVSQAARLCGGVSDRQLDESRERRAVLGLKTADGVMVYPTFQFDEQNRILSGLPEVLACFPAGYVEDWALAGWLVSPLRGLDGLSVVQWLRSGRDLAAVLVLARDTARRLAQ